MAWAPPLARLRMRIGIELRAHVPHHRQKHSSIFHMRRHRTSRLEARGAGYAQLGRSLAKRFRNHFHGHIILGTQELATRSSHSQACMKPRCYFVLKSRRAERSVLSLALTKYNGPPPHKSGRAARPEPPPVLHPPAPPRHAAPHPLTPPRTATPHALLRHNAPTHHNTRDQNLRWIAANKHIGLL